jgi:hypothetical protein
MNILSNFENKSDAFIKGVVIVVLGFLIYSNVLYGEFVSDDYVWIVDNPSITQQNLSDVWDRFNTRFIAGLSFFLNYRLGGLDTFGYHFLNIIFHIINAFLVYFLVIKISQTPGLKKQTLNLPFQWIAFYAALIFLAHPMQAEGVAYISQRFVSLSTIFYLGTLIAYIKARLEGKAVFYVVVVFLMLMGLFTKEMAATLPLNLILIELLFFGSSWKVDSKRLLLILTGGIALVVIPLFVAHTRFEERLLLGPSVAADHSFVWAHCFAEINVLRRYLTLFVFPLWQSHSYDYLMGDGWGGASTIFSIVLLIVLIVYAFKNFRKEKVLSYAILWFFMTTSIEAVFAVLYADRHNTFMADRWAYLSMVGFSIFLSWAVVRLIRNDRLSRVVLLIIVFVLSLLCYQRNKVWQTEIVLWEDVLHKNPKTLVHYLALGVAYDRKGRWQDARTIYHKGIDMYERGELTDPSLTVQKVYMSRIYNNWGIIAANYEQNGPKAREYFHRAMKFDKSNADTIHNFNFIKDSSPAETTVQVSVQ